MKFGTDKDYIMTSPLSTFDDYDKWDVLGIQYDLSYFDERTNPSSHKTKVIARYMEVLHYIEAKLMEKK